MVTKKPNKERATKISNYLLDKIQKFRKMKEINKSNYPSDKNFVDRAVYKLLLEKKLVKETKNG